MIAHNQERATHHFNYADEFIGDGNTFDNRGDYNCGRCNMADDGKCLLIDIKAINLTAGSCEDWESIRAGDPEMLLNRKDKDVANYGVAANGIGIHLLNEGAGNLHLRCGQQEQETFINCHGEKLLGES